MSEKKRPPFNKVCRIRTKDGEEYEAKLIHLNPRYHRKAEDLNVWRREGAGTATAELVGARQNNCGGGIGRRLGRKILTDC